MAISIVKLLEVLKKEYGDPEWWPGDSRFEVAVGAILTQRSSWRNVEIAIAGLREHDMLSPDAIARSRRQKLERIIRPSGFYKQKAKYLLALATHIRSKYRNNVDAMRARPTGELRKELLELPGIGSETADSILLYALGKPSFVVDAYTIRLLYRLKLSLGPGYRSVKQGFEKALGKSIQKYSLMHALIVTHCKTRCRTIPLCGTCPLRGGCPSGREKKQ